jgi:hypothetical protein
LREGLLIEIEVLRGSCKQVTVTGQGIMRDIWLQCIRGAGHKRLLERERL